LICEYNRDHHNAYEQRRKNIKYNVLDLRLAFMQENKHRITKLALEICSATFYMMSFLSGLNVRFDCCRPCCADISNSVMPMVILN
jgi:hypothetical protein